MFGVAIFLSFLAVGFGIEGLRTWRGLYRMVAAEDSERTGGFQGSLDLLFSTEDRGPGFARCQRSTKGDTTFSFLIS